MAAVSRSRNSNRILNAMSSADFGLLQPNLEAVDLPLRQDLEKPNKRIDYVYFIGAGIASVVAVQSKQTRVEVGLIGCEGMSGAAIVLGGDRTPLATYIQATAEGQRIPTVELRKAMKASESLHAACCSNTFSHS